MTSLLSFDTTRNGENDKHKVSRPVGDPLQPLVAREKCVFPNWLQVFAVRNQVKLIAKRLLHQNLPCDFHKFNLLFSGTRQPHLPTALPDEHVCRPAKQTLHHTPHAKNYK